MEVWGVIFLGVIALSSLVQAAFLIGVAARAAAWPEAGRIAGAVDREIRPTLEALTRVTRNIAEISDLGVLQGPADRRGARGHHREGRGDDGRAAGAHPASARAGSPDPCCAEGIRKGFEVYSTIGASSPAPGARSADTRRTSTSSSDAAGRGPLDHPASDRPLEDRTLVAAHRTGSDLDPMHHPRAHTTSLAGPRSMRVTSPHATLSAESAPSDATPSRSISTRRLSSSAARAAVPAATATRSTASHRLWRAAAIATPQPAPQTAPNPRNRHAWPPRALHSSV